MVLFSETHASFYEFVYGMKAERKRFTYKKKSNKKDDDSVPRRKSHYEPPFEKPKLDPSPSRKAAQEKQDRKEDRQPLHPPTTSLATPSTSKSLDTPKPKRSTQPETSPRPGSSENPVSPPKTPPSLAKLPVSPSRFAKKPYPPKPGGLLRSAGLLKSSRPPSKPHAKSPVVFKPRVFATSTTTKTTEKAPKDTLKETKQEPQPSTSTGLKRPEKVKPNNKLPHKAPSEKVPTDNTLLDKDHPQRIRETRVRFEHDPQATGECNGRKTHPRPDHKLLRRQKSVDQLPVEAAPAGVVTQQPTNRYLLHRESTTSDHTYPTDTNSNERITSTDSGAQTAEGHYYPEQERRPFSSLRPTSDSYRNLASRALDHAVYRRAIYADQPNYLTNLSVNPYLDDYINHPVPGPSGYLRRQRRQDCPPVHRPPSFRPQRQQSVPADIHEAPSSHLREPQLRERSFHEEPLYTRERTRTRRERLEEPWTYEDYERIALGRRRYAGPRSVVFIGLDEAQQAAEGAQYRLEERAAAVSPNYTYRDCYYGADSPSKPFRSYLGTREQAKAYSITPATTLVKNIYETYYTNRKEIGFPVRIMNPLEDHERKIIIEFCHLLEKSKQLFNGLRELPQYGHKQWSLYFGRTFDIYTRLWKYQQQHRTILDSKYGMKRWQIGEIASKIGQLYYHFYLRTSETAYLSEAYSFYFAIRGRCYYTKANKEDKCELMVKKLRYYARFIVVSLLLNKIKLVKELIKELERQIIEYGNTYDPDDQVEWTVVVDEVKAFVHAEPVVSVISHANNTLILTHRLSPSMTPPVERTSQMNLSLQEILIVGSSSQQVKFSELTMDMFRMLQTLEREIVSDVAHVYDESPRQRFMAPNVPLPPPPDGLPTGQKHPNPHKYLLFKPSPSQLLVYLASGCHDLPPDGALLLYISADGHVPQLSKHAEEDYELGGLITTSKNDLYRDCSKDPKTTTASKHKEPQCLYPADLHPYTRRPLFVIIDSDNSYAFQNIPRHFGQPLIILMSPIDMPPSYHDPRRQGSMFTLFLHSPLEGLCYCCDLSSVAQSQWDRATILLEQFMVEACAIFVRSRLVEPTFITFMGDDFLRVLILRYVFCEASLRLHRLFRARTHRTRSSPVLPDDLFEHPTLVHIILDIANVLQIRNHLQDPAMATREGPSGGN